MKILKKNDIFNSNKKSIFSLKVVVLFFLNFIAFSQTITPIDGNTTNTNNGVIYGLASESVRYSLFQHIYKQALINQSGTISHIEFENQMNGTFTNVSIYLGETTKSNFSSSSDWVNTGLTLVYSGNLNIVNGWYQIQLSTPFNYTNTNNLILVVHQNGGSTPNSLSARHIVGTGDANVTIRNFRTSSFGTYPNWDGGTGFRNNNLPSLKLIFQAGCSAEVLSTTPSQRCGAGTVELKATVSTGTSARWFDSETNGNLLSTGSTFITPALTQSTTYWAEAFNSLNSCSSSRSAVTATVNEIPQEPNVTNCWDNFQLSTVSCTWVNIGTQPERPQTDCYEIATFNEISCTWNIANTLSNDVTQNDNILAAEQENVNYQWINCTTNLPIANAVNQTFIPTESGNYAVQLTETNTNCTLQSDCIAITVLSLSDVDTQKVILFPNPAKQTIQILGANIGDEVQLISIGGQILYTLNLKHTEEQITLPNLTPALYFLKVKANNGEKVFKLLIQ
jgi:hypothetical protein